MKKNKYILLEKNMYRLALPGKEEAKKVIEMMK